VAALVGGFVAVAGVSFFDETAKCQHL